MVLIPKCKGAENLKDFRPISLTGSLYKLLAKILANKLERVINKLENKAHNIFVEGRQILDFSLVANEIINSIVTKKDSGIMCKLDNEKTYDYIH